MNHLTLLIKPASSLCNMRCRYCFYRDEAENRTQNFMGIMSRDTAVTVLEKAMDYIGEGGMLSVVFQGGEPTLAGAEYFRFFAQTAAQKLPQNAKIHYAIQTNGYHLTEELLTVLKEHHFLVGISLDGFRALHDSNRVDTADTGTWQTILRNLKRFQAAGLETNVLCVITGQAARQIQKIYKMLKQLGFRYHQYIPCLDPLETERGSQPFSLMPEAYGQFLKEAFDLWYDDWRRGDYVSIRSFEDFVYNAMGRPCINCAASGVCGQYLVVEADGSAYPCDFFALDRWRMGSLRDEGVAQLLESEAARTFAAQRHMYPPECTTCPHRQLCRTGCFRDWETVDGIPHNYYCLSFRMLFDYASTRLHEIAATQRG